MNALRTHFLSALALRPPQLAAIFLLAGSFFASPLLAQRQPIAGDMPFFQEKKAQYQRWLDATGLGAAIKVDRVRLKPRDTTELELLLVLHGTTNVDTAIGHWRQLRHDFEKAAGSRSLTATLFQTFISMMEIPPSQGNVQVYVRGQDGRYLPCFFVWAWEENGVPRDSLHLDACKSQPLEIEVPALTVKKIVQGKTISQTRVLEANRVFDEILRFARERYPATKYVGADCAGRYPQVVEERRSPTRLVFSVSDLCREALSNERLSIWCDLARATGWNRTCNDIKRERLEFEFNYIPLLEGNRIVGFRLDGTLRGKFGSGVYMPRKSGYMDMDPDFIDFEEDYARVFQQQLRERLAAIK